MEVRLRRSWLVTPSLLFLQGSLKGAIAELFRTFQGVIVPERPAVHCSLRSRSQQCHPSPAEWAGCRVADSHPPTNEPCRLSYSEHRIAPMRLTAAAWSMAPAGSPSQDKTIPTRQSHRSSKKITKKTKTNSGRKTHHQTRRREIKEEELNKKGAPGGAESLQAYGNLTPCGTGEIHDVSEFQCHFGTSFWEPASALF